MKNSLPTAKCKSGKTKLLFTTLTIFLCSTLTYAQPGSLDLSFDPGSGPNVAIFTTSIQNDGKIIIGGSFTSYNGTTRSNIARLNNDGSLDTTFNPGTGANDWIVAISIQNDGKIIIGGQFTSFNGTARKNIIRLNTNGSIDASFDLGVGTNWPVHTISIQPDGKIIIGGSFTSYNGSIRNRIARLNEDGSLDNSFTPWIGPDDIVYCTSIQSDGKIVIGGKFTDYYGTARNYIARVNVDGSLDTSFDPGNGTNDDVQTVSIQPDGKIIIGGDFTTYNGTPRNHIARLNSDGSLDTSFEPGTGTSDFVYTTSIQSDGKIIIGGGFTSYNGTGRNRIGRLNTNGSLDTSFDPGSGTNHNVYSTTIQSDGKIIIGGVFTNYDGTPRNYIARLEGTSVGIDQLENEDKNFTLFPNPFNNSTTLHSKVDLKNVELTVSNSTGQSVKQISNISSNTIILNRDNLSNGLYFIRLYQDNQIIMTDKFIITY